MQDKFIPSGLSQSHCADQKIDLRQVIEFAPATLGLTKGNSVPDILHAVREHLKMEVAFVSEFTNGRRIFRYVDSVWSESPVQVDQGGPLEDSYCQRIVDGRLPELINDAKAVPQAAEIEATFVLPVGAQMGVPIKLSDGSVYGTFCCFSRHADFSLNQRDLNLMRVFADVAGKLIDRERIAHQNLHEMNQRIHQVIFGDALHIVYQPIYDLSCATIVGFEALSRFSAPPTRAPNLWFSEAHTIGLGVELELKAIGMALQTKQRINAGLDLAVNASPETILHPKFEKLLSDLNGFRNLVLEITEHAAVEKYEEIASRLKPYRDDGLHIAVDDAGAGYASFRHILNLQPDRIKLDMSLTRNIDTDPAKRALAAALIHFCAETGSMLVAEGVETAGEVATLIELGVKKAQGYFLGKPMSLRDLQVNGWLEDDAHSSPESRTALT